MRGKVLRSNGRNSAVRREEVRRLIDDGREWKEHIRMPDGRIRTGKNIVLLQERIRRIRFT